MNNFSMKPVIDILTEILDSAQLESERLEESIDTLERIKSTIDSEDDETIDKVDEIQDYLQYLLTIEEPFMEEIKEELADIIDSLKK